MMAPSLPDVLRGFERSYSRLADQATDMIFSAAIWFSRGSWFEIGLKVGAVVAALGVIHYALGGATAMGDEKPLGPTIMWILVFVAVGIVIAVVMIKS
jgi:hypothetical protein